MESRQLRVSELRPPALCHCGGSWIEMFFVDCERISRFSSQYVFIVPARSTKRFFFFSFEFYIIYLNGKFQAFRIKSGWKCF